VHTQRYEEYGRNKLPLLLELAGFATVEVYGDFSDAPAAADHRDLVFLAHK
jgi:hypothetical protein